MCVCVKERVCVYVSEKAWVCVCVQWLRWKWSILWSITCWNGIINVKLLLSCLFSLLLLLCQWKLWHVFNHSSDNKVSVGSISPMFYMQLLCTQISKAQRNTANLTVFFALLGSVRVQNSHKHVDEIDPGSIIYWHKIILYNVNFTTVLQAAFICADPKCPKRHWWLDCLFVLLGSSRASKCC